MGYYHVLFKKKLNNEMKKKKSTNAWQNVHHKKLKKTDLKRTSVYNCFEKHFFPKSATFAHDDTRKSVYFNRINFREIKFRDGEFLPFSRK